jgi:acyl carrier protein
MIPAPSLEDGTASARDIVRWAWEQGLGRDDFTDEDYFFSIGATSLDALRVITAIKRLTGKKLPVSMLYKHQTVAGLAAVLDES